MTFRGLCELAAVRGWVVALAVNHSGNAMLADDDVAYLRTLAIYDTRERWKEHIDPLCSVRLSEPDVTLDQAAEAIGITLESAGVV